MATVIKRCRGEKKNQKKDRWIYKKMMIAESEITDCLEQEVKSKIGNIFVNKKVLEEYSVKINNIHPYFCEHYKEKVQVDRNGYEYILFRIDAYFTEYLLAVEINEKNILTETSSLRTKEKKH